MFSKILAFTFLLISTFSTNAALYDRGNGLIYDDVLDVTWLQDANYARTSGYDADGKMRWNEAMTWADQLVYEGYSDWRLTSMNFRDINAETYYSADGELYHMYYNNLFNISYDQADDPYATPRQHGAQNSSFIDQSSGNTISFFNLDPTWINSDGFEKGTAYWYGNYLPDGPTGSYLPDADASWYLSMLTGTMDPANVSNRMNAWAVSDGDIVAMATAVPISSTVWLFGSALTCLFGFKRNK